MQVLKLFASYLPLFSDKQIGRAFEEFLNDDSDDFSGKNSRSSMSFSDLTNELVDLEQDCCIDLKNKTVTIIKQKKEYSLDNLLDLIKNISDFKSTFNKTQQQQLDTKCLGLHYRVLRHLTDKDKEEVKSPSDETLNLLKSLARKWLHLGKVKKLKREHIDQLVQTVPYKLFVEQLSEFEELQKEFFYWTIKLGNSVKVFIEYPYTVEKIRGAHLFSDRFAKYGKGTLKIEEISDSSEKLSKALICDLNDQKISITHPQDRIVCLTGYKITVQALFENMAKKNTYEGILEFTHDGIEAWDYKEWCRTSKDGQKKYIDLNQEEWWFDLPVIEILSLEEVCKTFHLHDEAINLKSGEWVVGACGASDTENLELSGMHAYLKIAIPHPNQPDKYIIPYFSKTAKNYPKSGEEWNKVKFDMVPATIKMPDEMAFSKERIHAIYFFVVSAERGKALMNLIKKDFFLAQENHLKFQYMIDNCTNWIVQILAELFNGTSVTKGFIEDLFKVSPIQLQSNMVYEILKWAPNASKHAVEMYATYQGSPPVVRKNSPWNTLSLYHPGNLHYLQTKGCLGYGQRVEELVEE